MTKPTKDEIARVRHIHEMLDYLAQTGVANAGASHDLLSNRLTLRDLAGATHTYTVEEVRRWPKMKAEFERTLHQSACVVAIGHTGFNSVELAAARAGASYWGVPDGALARGLCLYREMLDAGPAREEPKYLDCKVCGTPRCADDAGCLSCGANPEPAAKAPDPYKLPHDKNPNGYDEKRIAQVMVARDGAHNGKEPSARDRLITALAAEQRDGEAKSILLKHPHPGRNFALKNHR